MTTDPTPLRESIARALDPSSWRLHDSGTFPPEHQASQAVIRRSMDDAAAVLPLIAAEVRKAQADALRQAARDLSWFGAQGNTLDHLSAWGVVQTCMKAIESTADRIEQED